MKRWYCFTAFLALLLFSPPVVAEQLTLAVAASLTEAVRELVADYREIEPEVTIQTNFASSGSLAKQILAGAPADIYISANPKWMQQLQQQGMIAPDAARVLVHNRLVFVGPATTEVQSLTELTKLSRIALGSPKAVPAGRYAEQALTAAGIYSQLQESNQLIFTKDVRQALLYADRGEVNGAFVYRTDALPAKRAVILFHVPEELYPRVTYPAAVTKVGEKNQAAADFFAYLFSSGASQVWLKYGFPLPD